MEQLISFVRFSMIFVAVPFGIAVCAVPIIKKIGLHLGAYAFENSRTVHEGKMVQIGGVAIFLAYIISMTILLDTDTTINSILIAGSIIFFIGLIDDMINIHALIKLGAQILATIVVIHFGGIYLSTLHLPLGIVIETGVIGKIITFFWIVGITNAINLIDGLDGLSSGISIIVLFTIAFLGFVLVNTSVAGMAMILLGATLGFWFFNFHPASIFMGDCGALFLGFMIACFSLLGFKTVTFITLALPIMILFVPILDTVVAIVRRKLRGDSFSVADREHLHHTLMFKLNLGHKKSVLILYVVTLLFSLTAIISFYRETIGMIILLILVIGFELFIEYTNMINSKYRPLLGLSRRVFGFPKKRGPETNKEE